MKIFIISIIMIMMIPYGVKSQDDNWLVKLKQITWLKDVSKIKLLTSTRQEVEQVLGKPDTFDFESANWIEYFSTKNGRVTITYTTKECKTVNGIVNKGVVEEILFSPNSKISLKSLKLPLNKFVKSKEDDVPSSFIYENKKNGLKVYGNFNYVNELSFFPIEQEMFDCPED